MHKEHISGAHSRLINNLITTRKVDQGYRGHFLFRYGSQRIQRSCTPFVYDTRAQYTLPIFLTQQLSARTSLFPPMPGRVWFTSIRSWSPFINRAAITSHSAGFSNCLFYWVSQGVRAVQLLRTHPKRMRGNESLVKS